MVLKKPILELEAQSRLGGGETHRFYSGVCANRGTTVHRSKRFTTHIMVDDQDVRVGRCQCGLLVFLEETDASLYDYRGADHD